MGLSKKLLSILLLLTVFISNEIKAQTEKPAVFKDYRSLSELDEKPTFPGGIEEFYKFIGKNYKAPHVEGLAGKIYVTFIIEKDGSVTEIKVLRDIGYDTGKEAIRVLENCPKWNPGKQKGETVRVLYSLPITISTPPRLSDKDAPLPINKIEKKPEFPGGMEAFYQFVGKNFKMPSEAVQNKLQGKVYLKFIIEKDGSVSEVTIIRDLGYGCGDEAIRVLKLLSKWSPGIQNGVPVRVLYALPINIAN